jgi:transposase
MSSPKSKESRCLDILKAIKAEARDPASLLPDERRPLVAVLMAEGQSTAEIAHLLQTSDRTIERDKQAIRKNNAISQDPELANIMAGRLLDEAQICIQRIRKFERDGNCPPAAKIEGEKVCFQITNDLAERLQSMGYLPTVSKKLEADLVHHMDNTLSLAEIGFEAQRLQDVKASLPEKKTKKVKSRTVKRKGKNNDQA